MKVDKNASEKSTESVSAERVTAAQGIGAEGDQGHLPKSAHFGQTNLSTDSTKSTMNALAQTHAHAALTRNTQHGTEQPRTRARVVTIELRCGTGKNIVLCITHRCEKRIVVVRKRKPVHANLKRGVELLVVVRKSLDRWPRRLGERAQVVLHARSCVCVCVRVSARVCVCVCVCACIADNGEWNEEVCTRQKMTNRPCLGKWGH
jgi:hypothetical protein